MVSVMTSIWLGDGNAHDDELSHHYLAGLIDDVVNNDNNPFMIHLQRGGGPGETDLPDQPDQPSQMVLVADDPSDQKASAT